MTETDSFIRFFLGCKKRFKRYSKEKIQRYQDNKGKEIVKTVIEKAPFFKRYYSDYNLNKVWELPTANKKIMMDNLSDYNTIGFQKKDLIAFVERIEKEKNYDERFQGYNVAMSSGTSGSKGIVITSPREEKYLQAAFFARFSFPFTLRIKWAFLLRVTTPAFQVSKFGQKLTHISLQLPLEAIREQLQTFQPNILSAPPSMLKIIAKEINESNLEIKPKRVVSYAEVLEPEIKKELEEVFQTPIHQIYQCSEGAIGMTCKHGSLHINEDLVKLQLYNKDGSLTELGETCFTSVVTDLHKTSQPIIRFELNDIIKLSDEKCNCGSSFRVIDQIMGRADDLFWGKSKSTGELQYIFPDYIRRAIITSSETIEEYQAVQKAPTKVIIRLLLTESLKEKVAESVKRKVREAFLSYDCEEPTIEIRFEKPVKNPNSNKLIRIIRDFEV
jgi:putative adenylate-forming enzyme